MPAAQILQKLQEQNRWVKSAALLCGVEYIAPSPFTDIRGAASGRWVASQTRAE